MINESGEFISPPEPIEEYVPTYYKKIAYCSFEFNHTNGTDETNGSITSYCKGSDIVKNMIKTKYGLVCYRCYDVIPDEHIEDLTIKRKHRKMPKE